MSWFSNKLQWIFLQSICKQSYCLNIKLAVKHKRTRTVLVLSKNISMLLQEIYTMAYCLTATKSFTIYFFHIFVCAPQGEESSSCRFLISSGKQICQLRIFSTSKEKWTRLLGLIGDTFITRSACLETMNPWALGWKSVTVNYISFH